MNQYVMFVIFGFKIIHITAQIKVKWTIMTILYAQSKIDIQLQETPLTQIKAGRPWRVSGGELPVAPLFKTIPNLHILGILGHGANAQVEALSEQLVLKTPRMGNMAGLDENFKEEAALLCSVDSPFVVRGYGYLEADKNSQHGGILMERCSGSKLEEYLEHATIDQTLTWLFQIAQAIQHLHQIQVVHLDLSPSNIMVTENNGIKVIDLGSARLVTPNGDCAEKNKMITAFGSAMYMPPEQLGLSVDDDLRPCDLYALGAMIIDLVVGEKFPLLINADGVPCDLDGEHPLSICYRKYTKDLVLNIPLQDVEGALTLSPALQQKYPQSDWGTLVNLLQLAQKLTAYDPHERGHINEITQQLTAIMQDYKRFAEPVPALSSSSTVRLLEVLNGQCGENAACNQDIEKSVQDRRVEVNAAEQGQRVVGIFSTGAHVLASSAETARVTGLCQY